MLNQIHSTTIELARRISSLVDGHSNPSKATATCRLKGTSSRWRETYSELKARITSMPSQGKTRSLPSIVGELPDLRKNCVALSILHSIRKIKGGKLTPSVLKLNIVSIDRRVIR